MSRANKMSQVVADFIGNDEPEEVDVVVGCEVCFEQPDKVYFKRGYGLLFWTCPNGHKGFIEDFSYLG